MRVPLIRSAAGLVGAFLLALALLPMQAAWGATENDVLNGDEAWFLANAEPLASLPTGDPTCQLPTGCNAAGNANRKPAPHPEGVLVVAANAGEDDAQTYFNFNTEKLPLGAVITGGTVTMPVAPDPEAGNFRADAANMVACLVTGFIPGGADGGSYEDRPEFDDKTCVDVVVAEDADILTYTFSLERFGKEWANGTSMNGVTILKDPEIKAPAPDESWRVVFNTARRHNNAENPEEFPPIVSDLQYKVVATPTVDVPDTTTTGTGGGFPPADPPPPMDTSDGGFDPGTTSTDSGTVPTTGTSGAPATSDTASVDEPVAAEGEEAAAPVAAPAADAVPAAAPGLSPAVWLMPLLALAMAGVLGWSLSAPVELAGQREGAVSKLMRNRRMAGESTPAT